ncbi:MAG: ester cyclase [Anaerolineales bacterium]|nr:ester cyclase [Anaerolineales bacterium]
MIAASPDLTAAVRAVEPYFDAWNRHDAAALAASLTPEGAYRDPLVPNGVNGPGLAAYAGGLWAAFPDLRFEIVSLDAVAETRVAAQWRMLGTNTGPFNGLPPTGRPIDVIGSDFITVRDGRVQVVQGYFDGGAVPRQLGLQVVVQPHAAGPFQFGTSTSVSSGRRVEPGEFTLTVLQAGSPEAVQQIRDLSRGTALDMLKMKGFLSWTGVVIGNRMLTVTAWENPGDSRQLMQGGVHAQAAKQFYATDWVAGGLQAWLAPSRFLETTRCPACGRMLRDTARQEACECGAALPAQRLAW